jgi:hypothetical protein
MAQQSVSLASARRICHLALLQMEARVGKRVEIAGMIVVQMRDNHVLDVARRDAE